jgi:nicotinate-nucleotide adenylyltransferase
VNPRARESNKTAAPRLPPHAPGMKIGLFGGSFNPPHAAHRAASLMALKRLGLDRIWWLASPGNPLKDTSALPPLADRVAAAQKRAAHPRIDVTGIEAAIGTRYSFDTLQWLRRRLPGVHFVWIMGADNLATFHHWQNWRGIAALMPIAVIDRDGAIRAGPFADRFSRYRLSEAQARRLALTQPPAWVFLHGVKSPVSSTALRAAGG